MHFLIVSRVSIPAKDRTLPCWEYLRSLGHTVTVEHPDSPAIMQRPDVIISMGVTIMDETFAALKRFPGVPMYAYNWDVYAWTWTNPRPGEYDYRRYGELLRLAKEIWVPSYCTGQRCEQWYHLRNWHVILSACPWWEHDNIRDDGYALCCLREIPDPWWGVFEKACEEMKIPYKCTRHEVSYEAYQDAVAGCRFLCAPLYELSTGGLSLMEGYYHGKPVLISDSQWNGGRDYFKERAHYFKHGDVGAFERALVKMHGLYRNHVPDRAANRTWIRENFSDKRMVDDMLRRVL